MTTYSSCIFIYEDKDIGTLDEKKHVVHGSTFYFFLLILDIVYEAPSYLTSSARVQIHSRVNFGEQNRIL